MSAVMCTPAVIAADRFAAAVGQSVAVASSNSSQGFHGKKLTSQLYACLTYSMEAASKRQMESSLIRLNFLLGRPSDIGLVQIDSEESAEVFQLR